MKISFPMLVVVGLAAGAVYLIVKPRLEAKLAESASFNKSKGADLTSWFKSMDNQSKH